jgi:hypothetical protein
VIKATIDAGVCGFRTVVEAESDDMQNVVFRIETDCENIRAMAGDLETVDGYQELGDGYDGQVLGAARKHLKGCCSACIVPSGIFKAMQVAAGVSLVAPCSIAIERD